MLAVIMAGGEGSRLRPITCEIPKPLAPLCGRPVIEYILDLLQKHGCDRAVLTAMYLHDRLAARFPDGDYRGLPLSFAVEKTPLGTAGSVKNAVKAADDDFLVISGDAMCDFDLTAAFRFHREKKAAATLLTVRVDDPREYGLVKTDEKGRITGFLEKPSRLNDTEGQANTGVYILSPKVLELIPEGKPFDFSFDLFPKMLKRGLPLFACEAKGYWRDIGDVKSYLDCQREMLEGRVRCEIPGAVRALRELPLLPAGTRIEPPVFLGKNVTLGEDVLIGAGSVLCDNVSVGRRSKIRGAILLAGASVGEGCGVNRAVICEDAVLESGSGAFEYAVAGRGAVVSEESFLHPRVKVWDRKVVPPGILLRENLKQGDVREIVCEEKGIEGELGSVVTPQFGATLGSALGSLKAGGPVGVGCDGTAPARALAAAVLSGVSASGCDGYRFDAEPEPVFRFALRRFDCGSGVFVRVSGGHVSLLLNEGGGLPMTRRTERELEGYLNRGEYKRAAADGFGTAEEVRGTRLLYLRNLVRRGGDLSGLSVRFEPPLSPAEALLRRTLEKTGCRTEDGVRLSLSADGARLTAFDSELGEIPHERLVVAVCGAHFGRGEDVSLPNRLYTAADEAAARYRRTALRYAACACDHSDEKARALAAAEPFAEDGMLLAVELLSHLKKTGRSLRDLLRDVPPLAVAERRVETGEKSSEIFRRLGASASGFGEGVRLSDRRGELLLRPAKSGRGIFIYAESKDVETAEELCGFYGKLIEKGPLC